MSRRESTLYPGWSRRWQIYSPPTRQREVSSDAIPDPEAQEDTSHGRPARPGARDAALPERPRLPYLRDGWRGREEPGSFHAGRLPALHKPRRCRGEEGGRSRGARGLALRHPEPERRGG